MSVLQELNEKFDMDSLAFQLETVIESKDPLGYMKSNINWEIDKDLDVKTNFANISSLMSDSFSSNVNYESWNPIRKFLNWLNRNKTAKQVKKILCSIASEIQKQIDEEAELTKMLGVVIAAIAAAIGIGAINPLILTLVVGFLATMILKGVSNFCAI